MLGYIQGLKREEDGCLYLFLHVYFFFKSLNHFRVGGHPPSMDAEWCVRGFLAEDVEERIVPQDYAAPCTGERGCGFSVLPVQIGDRGTGIDGAHDSNTSLLLAS